MTSAAPSGDASDGEPPLQLRHDLVVIGHRPDLLPHAQRRRRVGGVVEHPHQRRAHGVGLEGVGIDADRGFGGDAGVAFWNWSAPNGTSTGGTPMASAARNVPDPACEMTAAARGSTSPCGTNSATSTFGGWSPRAAASVPGPSVTRTLIGRSRMPSSTARWALRSRLKTVPNVT